MIFLSPSTSKKNGYIVKQEMRRDYEKDTGRKGERKKVGKRNEKGGEKIRRD